MVFFVCVSAAHVLVVVVLFVTVGVCSSGESWQISRDDFPEDFVFGAGTSSFQVEGAAAEDGRSPCVWDDFSHAGKMIDKSNGDITADQYHKYKEDVKLMSEIGLEAYRFSISWSRLIPKGRGDVNPKGVEYYNNLINELVHHGIEPHVTLVHLDLPQILEDEYGGWLNRRIVDDFAAYVDVCFREFGDRVLHWTTLNEPNIYAIGGYDEGILPPQRCTGLNKLGINCTAGNSSVEPYVAAHHQLLCHAAASQVYRQKYQAKQNGQIGINIYTLWADPLTNSTADVAAAQRAHDFIMGWFLHPLVFGDYPETMKEKVNTRLPSFSKNESKLLKGSADFFGINHYTTVGVGEDSDDSSPKIFGQVWGHDLSAKLVFISGNSTSKFLPGSFPIIPWGLERTLDYWKTSYGNPPVYVYENGFGTLFTVSTNDTERAYYLEQYIKSLLNAIRSGSNARGYFVWSLIDAWEILTGYLLEFGLIEVDFNDVARPRRLKDSAYWYSNFLKKGKALQMKNFDELTSSQAAE